MRNICRWFFSTYCILQLTACGESGDVTATVPENITGVNILSYEEREAGTDIYSVRVLVSPGYVRFDDGYAASDFALLDRQSKTVFSVSHEDRSILVIEYQPGDVALPADINLTETRTADNAAPAIAGKQPVHINYLANGDLCFQAVTVPAVMRDAVAGMAEYAEVLARRQLNDMEAVPVSMQTPCFLSRYVTAAARQYRDGLPVQEWDDAGYFRTLSDFVANETVPAALFELPGTYERFSPGQ
ncbi:MAG TPA: hypothetical protein DCO71_05240 [Gammaproteobacteria bacterium]|nr:hypothetical protein [Gammaproteobacteria bacterium]